MDLKDEKSDEKLFETVKSNELSMTANLLESNKSMESFKNKKIGKIAKSFLENKSNNESNTQSPFHTPISTFKPTPKGLLLDMEFKLENQSKKYTNTITNIETNNIVIEEEGIISVDDVLHSAQRHRSQHINHKVKIVSKVK